MAISFKSIKSTNLGMLDKITTGKLQGCRVCDVIPDHYEYLIWAEKSGLLKFNTETTKFIQQQAGYVEKQRHYDEEVKPWLDEDIPF